MTAGGSGYKNGEQLYFDSSDDVSGGIGGNASGFVVTSIAGISTADGNYVQITGISTGTDSYHRISSITSKNAISIHKETTDLLLNGQQVIDLGPWSAVGSATTTSGTTTFNTTAAHGLLVGNSFRVLNASDQSLGDFIVKTVVDVDTFTASTSSALTSPAYILKHGLSANDAASNVGEENLGIRGSVSYTHLTLPTNDQV